MRSLHKYVSACLAAVVLATSPCTSTGQIAGPPESGNRVPETTTPVAQVSDQASGNANSASQTRPVRARDRRRAAKLYLEATDLFEKGEFERALDEFKRAAELDPNNQDYALAAQVARSHAVSSLIQAAAKARAQGNNTAARAALERARDLDPNNPQLAEHVYDLADATVSNRSSSLYDPALSDEAEAPNLEPTAGAQDFHLRMDRRQLIQKVFKSYGIDASIDQSVSAVQTKFDLDAANFQQAVEAISLATDSFWVPLDAHRVLVAKETRQNRDQYQRQEVETVYLPGFSPAEMTEVSNLANKVFDTPPVAVAQNAGAITVRGPANTLNAFNATMQDLVGARSEVMLDVRIIQLAHTSERNTGVQLPQQVTAFNVYAEEQSLLNANQALVQQIIASGLAAPGDTLAILGILLASGQISSSLFSNGIALFGGGLTLSGLSPGATTLNLSLNSSDSRALDNVELRLEDGRDETIRSGMRYPILVASYSGLATNGVNIPGLTTAGSSGGLSSILSSISGATTQIPQVQYQDIGLTLKATPKVMRTGDVALTLDLKITALAGSSLNGIPLMTNREFSGVVTLKEGAGAVLLSELDKQESQALSGTPGLTEIPGLNNVTDKDVQNDYATLLIAITPRLISGPQNLGHGPMIRVERSSQTH